MRSSCDADGSLLLLSVAEDDFLDEFLPLTTPPLLLGTARCLELLLELVSRNVEASFFFALRESRSSACEDLRFDDDEEVEEDDAFDRSSSALRPRNDAEMDPDEPEPPFDELVPLIVPCRMRPSDRGRGQKVSVAEAKLNVSRIVHKFRVLLNSIFIGTRLVLRHGAKQRKEVEYLANCNFST